MIINQFIIILTTSNETESKLIKGFGKYVSLIDLYGQERKFVIKMTITKLVLTSFLAMVLVASHGSLERLALPLAPGDSRTYAVVQAVKSRESIEGATITLENDKMTITQGECSFGGEFDFDNNTLKFAFREGTYFRSFGMCHGAIGDVQMMVNRLFDLNNGYFLRAKVFSSEWFVLGWNSAEEGQVDLLVGQKVIPNEHSLNPE